MAEGTMYLLYSVYDGAEEKESRGEQQERWQLSLKPNSQTLRRSADRKIDHALRLIYFERRICYGCNYLHY